MFAVVVTFYVAPGQLPNFLPLMQDNARRSLELEPGCHRFDVCTDPARPDEVFLYEIYSSPEAFSAHLDSAHFKAFDAAVAAMVTGKEARTFRDVTS